MLTILAEPKGALLTCFSRASVVVCSCCLLLVELGSLLLALLSWKRKGRVAHQVEGSGVQYGSGMRGGRGFRGAAGAASQAGRGAAAAAGRAGGLRAARDPRDPRAAHVPPCCSGRGPRSHCCSASWQSLQLRPSGYRRLTVDAWIWGAWRAVLCTAREFQVCCCWEPCVLHASLPLRPPALDGGR